MADSEASLLSQGSRSESQQPAQQAGTEGGYGTTERAKNLVQDPLQDVIGVKDELISIREFWVDMRKRERTKYHQATLLLGILLGLCVVAYCIVLEVKSKVLKESKVYSDYLAVELGMVGIAQLVFSFRGICLENSPMLLIANLNAIGLTVRIALSIHLQLLSHAADIAFLCLINLITVAHMATSFVAWGGEFTRYIAFVIGTNADIQRMYRHYQLLLAALLMDLQFLAMSCATIIFFTTCKWWHYVVVVGVFLVSIVIRSAVRRAVRQESLWGPFVLIPVMLLAPVTLGLAQYLAEFIETNIPLSCQKIAAFILIWFFAIRFICILVLLKCRVNAGKGLKAAFDSERTVRGYFAHRKAHSLEAFMAKAKRKVADV